MGGVGGVEARAARGVGAARLRDQQVHLEAGDRDAGHARHPLLGRGHHAMGGAGQQHVRRGVFNIKVAIFVRGAGVDQGHVGMEGPFDRHGLTGEWIHHPRQGSEPRDGRGVGVRHRQERQTHGRGAETLHHPVAVVLRPLDRAGLDRSLEHRHGTDPVGEGDGREQEFHFRRRARRHQNLGGERVG